MGAGCYSPSFAEIRRQNPMRKEYKNHPIIQLIALAVGIFGIYLFIRAWRGQSEPGFNLDGGMRYVVAGIAVLLILGPFVFWTERPIATEEGITWSVLGWRTSIKWEEIQRLSWQKLMRGIGFYNVTTNRAQPFQGKMIAIFSLLPGCKELKQSIIQRGMLTQVSKNSWRSSEMYDRLTEAERLRIRLQSTGQLR